MGTQTAGRYQERGPCLAETQGLTKCHLRCRGMFKTARPIRSNKISKTSSCHLELSRMASLTWEEVVQDNHSSIL